MSLEAPPPAAVVDPFFTLDGETEWNAFVGRQSNEDAYANGYIEAAAALCSTLIDSRMIGSRDTLVMPILYNARHGVELALKLALRRLQSMGLGDGVAKQDHDITALWTQLNGIRFGDEAMTAIVTELEPYVQSLGQVDRDGQDFRYAVRNDGERSMANHGLVNLKRIRTSLDAVRERLDYLRWRVDDLARERGTGAFTPECSRRDLMEIARTLPPRGDWSLPSFDAARDHIRRRFNLSSNAFSRALNVIQGNREMGTRIGLEFTLSHLTDRKVLDILAAWSDLYPPREREVGPILARIRPPPTPEVREILRRKHAAVVAIILDFVDGDELADLQTVFNIGRGGLFGEHYAQLLAQTKQEHALKADPRDELQYLVFKSNLASAVAEGVERLGRPSLATQIRDWRPDLFPNR